MPSRAARPSRAIRPNAQQPLTPPAPRERPVAKLLLSELEALRARLAQLWDPPGGTRDPSEQIVEVRIRLKPDGTLAAPPELLSGGTTPLFIAARDSAIRAVYRGQPYDM